MEQNCRMLFQKILNPISKLSVEYKLRHVNTQLFQNRNVACGIKLKRMSLHTVF